MGDAVVFWARFKGGQDYVDAVCSVVFSGEKYERPRRAPRCFLLEAVLAGAASGVAAARSFDRLPVPKVVAQNPQLLAHPLLFLQGLLCAKFGCELTIHANVV